MSLKRVKIKGNSGDQNTALTIAMLTGKKGKGVIAIELSVDDYVEFETTHGGQLQIDTTPPKGWPNWPNGLDVSQGANPSITHTGVAKSNKGKAYSFALKDGDGNEIDPVIIPR